MKEKYIALFSFILLVGFVIIGSLVSINIWSPKKEKFVKEKTININDSMTVNTIGQVNNIDRKILKCF